MGNTASVRLRYVTIKKFSELSGYSERAIYNKVHDGVWVQGRQYRKAPDGRTLIDLDVFEQWVEGRAPLAIARLKPGRGAKPPADRSRDGDGDADD